VELSKGKRKGARSFGEHAENGCVCVGEVSRTRLATDACGLGR